MGLESACQVKCFDHIAFAIDAEETARVIEGFGGKYFMTSPSCGCGTERLVELMESGKVNADFG